MGHYVIRETRKWKSVMENAVMEDAFRSEREVYRDRKELSLA